MAKRNLILLAVCCVFVGGLQAATIFERLGAPLTDWTVGDAPNQMLATSWFQDFSSTNTVIQVFGLQPAGAGAVHFDLMTVDPAGTLVSAADITFDPTNGPGNYTVFSGATLAPGTYFLVASILRSEQGTAATWTGLDPLAIGFQQLTDFGTHAGAGLEYFASIDTGGVFTQQELDLGFSVTGTEGAVPEPATCGLLLIGLGAAVLNRKRFAR